MASQSMLRDGLANLSFSKPAVSVNMPDDELMAEDWDDIRRGDHVPHIVFYKFKTFFRKKNPDGWLHHSLLMVMLGDKSPADALWRRELTKGSNPIMKPTHLKALCEKLAADPKGKPGSNGQMSCSMFMEILNSVYGSTTEERSGIKECNDKDRSEFFKKKFLPHMFPELSGVAVDPKRVLQNKASGCANSCKDCGFACKRCSQNFRFNLWGGFGTIEAKFGSSISAYFYFAQFMFWFNVALTLLALMALVVGLKQTEWFEGMGNLTRLIASGANQSVIEEFRGNFVPEEYSGAQFNVSWVGLFTGSNLAYSWLFYGYYDDHYDVNGNEYKMDVNWVLMCIFTLVLSLLVTISQVDITSFGEDDEIDVSSSFDNFSSVFGSFDFALQDENAIEIQRRRLLKQIDDSVQESEVRRKVLLEKSDKKQVLEIEARRTKGLYLTVLILLVTGVTLSILIGQSSLVTEALAGTPAEPYTSLIIPGTITFLKSATPVLIQMLVKYEAYQIKDQEFRALFGRIFILKMFLALMVFLSAYINRNIDGAGFCEQTNIGVVYYNTLILDLCVDCGTTVFQSWTIWRLKFCCKVGANATIKAELEDDKARAKFADEAKAKEIERKKTFGKEQAAVSTSVYSEGDSYKDDFAVIGNLINIMYMQSLVWCGMPYAPILPFIGAVNLFLIIWAKKINCLFLTKVPLAPMGVAKQANFVRSLLVGSLIVCLIPFAVFLQTDVTCGPNLANPYGDKPFSSMTEALLLAPGWVHVLFRFLGMPILLWIMILISLVVMNVEQKKNNSDIEEVKYLKRRIRCFVQEYKAIVSEMKGSVNQEHRSGRNLFMQWMKEPEMLGFADKYKAHFAANGFNDLNVLLKIDDDQLLEILKEWVIGWGQETGEHKVFVHPEAGKQPEEEGGPLAEFFEARSKKIAQLVKDL